jgi:hypothetical protein
MTIKLNGKYCEGSGNNSEILIEGKGRIYYSYETPIAVLIGTNLFVTTKKFSVTTGKHRNAITNQFEGSNVIKIVRLSQEDLEKKVNELTN